MLWVMNFFYILHFAKFNYVLAWIILSTFCGLIFAINIYKIVNSPREKEELIKKVFDELERE
jgi:hypothetical protein